jgi:hypothetical protein
MNRKLAVVAAIVAVVTLAVAFTAETRSAAVAAKETSAVAAAVGNLKPGMKCRLVTQHGRGDQTEYFGKVLEITPSEVRFDGQGLEIVKEHAFPVLGRMPVLSRYFKSTGVAIVRGGIVPTPRADIRSVLPADE